mgnify:CR=1 FL=1
MKYLLSLDASSIYEKIVSGSITSLEVVETYIHHLQGDVKKLNAIVEERFTEAIEEAKKADEYLKTKQKPIGPLHGVPISVKESFDVKGMKTTGGLFHLKDHVAKQDAFVVKKLKEAGAIILCKTNTSTLCYAQETVNKLYGWTNNPWDLTRSAGGSSGGEGALLAVGGAAIGIGSDIGGSIRFPSHLNGVIGFKSGMFQVDSTGHFPPDVVQLQKRMSSVGPMGKSVRDMERMYNIIAKEQGKSNSSEELTIQFLPDDQPYPISNKTKESINEVKEFLAKTFKVEEQLPPRFEESALLWQEMMSVTGSKDRQQLAFDGKKNLPFTYLKEKLTKKTDYHEFLLWAFLGSTLFKPSKKRVAEIEQLTKETDELLKKHFENRVLILPVYHVGARKHGTIFREIFSIKKTFKKYMPYTAYSNVWGLPTLTVPIGDDEENMPIAVQIISVNGKEKNLFKIGKILEQQFRGYKRNTNFDRSS